MPWVDPETLGPNRPGLLRLRPISCSALPNLLLISALFFALATVTRSMMATYLGVVAFLILYLADRHRRRAGQARAARHAGAGRAVRRRRLRPGHPLLDGRRAQHAAAGRSTGAAALEPPDLARRRASPSWRSPIALYRFAEPGLSKRSKRRSGAGRRGRGRAPSGAVAPLPRPRRRLAAAWAQLVRAHRASR